MKKELATLIVFLWCAFLTAQTTITGNVYDIYLETLPSIKVQTSTNNTRTNADGYFSLQVNETFPFSLEVSGIGYKTQVINITNNDDLTIVLEKQSKLQEIVVSASRTPEKILESPVTVERLGSNDIKNTASLNFYDDLANLKDVQLFSNSFTLKSINSRTFASLDNVRFVQLVDGADTAIPSYGFSLGNTLGLNNLDVESVEVLPGAASALYGANAFNGILVMNSKNPFNHTGISASFNTGVSNQKSTNKQWNDSPFYEANIRMGHKFSNKLAGKVSFNYTKANDWIANDTRNTTGLGGEISSGNRENTPNYDGVNIYGDELSISNKAAIGALQSLTNEDGSPVLAITDEQLASFPSFRITRTGYEEAILANNTIETIAFDGALYYRPTGKEDIELIWNSKYGYGDNSYRKGNSRIVQEGALNQLHKFEFKYKNLINARAYYSGFNQGDAYNTVLLGDAVNTAIKGSFNWFSEYAAVYANTYLALLNTYGAEVSNEMAKEAARNYADTGRPEVGSNEFNSILNTAKKTAITNNGAQLENYSGFYHTDVNLNFTDIIKVFGLQAGASYRKHKLDTNGVLFTDYNAPIFYEEYGAYTQISKKLADERLSIASSLRYDKSQNFKGHWSPRVSITYAAGANRNHNFRASYQTAFRNPTSEDQYWDTNLGSAFTAVGNIKANYDRYARQVELSPISPAIALLGYGQFITLTGDQIYNNSYTLESELAYTEAVNNDINSGVTTLEAYAINTPILQKATIDYVKPEKIETFEVGYRGEFGMLGSIFEVDVNAYFSQFDDYITTEIISTPFYGDTNTKDFNSALALNSYEYARHAIRVNAREKLNFYGGGISLNTKVFNHFNLGLNYVFAELQNQTYLENTLKPGFNTPKHSAKLLFGNNELFKNFGFNIAARWQDKFLWQDTFLTSYINARTVLDAQINLTVPHWKSNFKLGGTNLTANEYISASGLGGIGAVYYVNWTINN